jgi:hypothetical protein
LGRGGVFNDCDVDAVGLQESHEGIEFGQARSLSDWKALVGAVSGLNAKRAGRIIRTEGDIVKEWTIAV